MIAMKALACALVCVAVSGCTEDRAELTDDGPVLAAGLGVETALLYQVTEIPLLRSGETVMHRTVPVIAGRTARVYVTVRAAASTEERKVRVRARIGGAWHLAPSVIVDIVPGEATDVDIDIPGYGLAPDADIAISVEEFDGVARDGDTSVARWPASGAVSLLARDPGPMRWVLVPIQPNTFMGRNFDITPEMLAEIETDVLAQMPLRNAELQVHEPVRWPDDLSDFASWQQLVLKLANLRDAEGAAPDVYYYGMIPFTTTLALGGLAATLSDAPFWRVAIGVRGSRSNVMLHESFHLLGRSHTPCGDPGGPDPFYPYPGAFLGHTGYDYVNTELIDANTTYDVMSYCTPVWTSDYTYAGLFKSIRQVNRTNALQAPAPRERVYVYNLANGRAVAAGEYDLVVPALNRVSIDGVQRDVGLVTFHDGPGALLLTREPVRPGAVVNPPALGRFTLAGGAR